MTETKAAESPQSRRETETDDEGEVSAAVRVFEGPVARLFAGLCIALAVFAITANVYGRVSTLWLVGIHFAGFALLCAMRYPLRIGRWMAPLWFDTLIGIAIAGATLFIVASENAIYEAGVRLSTWQWIAAIVTIAGAIELTRRTTGWIIPVLILFSLAYMSFLGGMISGIFRFAGLSFETVVFRSIFADEGMFGTIGRISATFVFMFIIFGAFLVRSGAGDFIINLARAVAGKLVGGPGFVAVFSSGLTGTISGSAVANTVSTGVITIPLMKKSGFPPKFAAGVEAASSTGGQLMPPIMGAGAFVMASNTQIPYLDIVAVATLPAVLYFLSVAFFVRIEAKKHGIVGMEGDDPQSALEVIKEGGPSFLVPIAVLIYLLIDGYTPVYAAGFAILSVIVASWVTGLTSDPPSQQEILTRMAPAIALPVIALAISAVLDLEALLGLAIVTAATLLGAFWSRRGMDIRAIVEALVLGASNMIMTAVLLIAVGLITNVIAGTGIGNTFSLMISGWAGGNLLIAIVLIALASLVLGMGLPVTAAYIVLATLSAPALQALIQNAELIQIIAAGALPEAAKAPFMLADPAALTTLAAPMDLAAARDLVLNAPQEVLGLVYPSALDAASVTAALLSAHMIIFWLSQDSNVTPPVCLTAFAAAAIAKTPQMATGVMAWKLAKGLYIVPVLFAYTPFLSGDPLTILLIFLKGVVGVYGLSAFLEGHMEAPLGWPARIVAGVAGAAALWPQAPLVNAAGIAVTIALLALSVRTDRTRMATPVAA
ncbi:MAG: TRAP transporter fused permease subunit [Pseudomonadota bacterium]